MSTRRRTRVPELSPPRTRPSRSPARSRKVSPARKSPPARQTAPKPKSPSRKSPSRTKYPARKSPSRIVKDIVKKNEPEPVAVAIPRSPSKRPGLQEDVSVRLETLSSVYRITRSKRPEYSVKDVYRRESTPENNGIEVLGMRNRSSVDESYTPRRSSRLKEMIDVMPILPDIRRSVSKSISNISRTPSKSVSKSLDTYSDEEKSSDEGYGKRESTHSTRKLATPLRTSVSLSVIARQWEFGGRMGTAALIILIPLSLISILTSCMKSCSIHTLLNFSPYKSHTLWFSLPTSGLIAAQVLIQAIIGIFPYMGRKSEGMDDTSKKYCFNAIFSSIILISLVFILDYYNIISNGNILQEYLKLATASYIFAVILSIALYLKARKLEKEDLNGYANTGYVLYDFFLGREIHPCIKSLDVKIWISRICNINTLVLLLIILYNRCSFNIELASFEDITSGNIPPLITKLEISNPTVLVFTMMQIVYILKYIVMEYRVTSTFFWNSEGMGYLQIVASALYPFFFTTVSKHIADSGLTLPTYVLVIASLVYLLGWSLMFASNDIKYEFRRNPLQPSLACIDSMITFNGKRLITSHLWGIIRHPNYTGDIIIHVALALPGLLSGEIIAASPALITILVLLHRAWRDDARCQRRYGSAWSRYCKKVPSVIVPKIWQALSLKRQ